MLEKYSEIQLCKEGLQFNASVNLLSDLHGGLSTIFLHNLYFEMLDLGWSFFAAYIMQLFKTLTN